MAALRSSMQKSIEQDIENKKYNPMNDVLFKFLFGKEERKQITIDFLNAVLERSGEKAIKDIQFQNSELVPDFEDDKLTRLDIFCILGTGEQVDVEVQIVDRKNMERRTLFYWSQMYLRSLTSGTDYRELKPSITINILRYNLLPQENPHTMYGVYNLETLHRLLDDLELHFLEVPKFQKKPVAAMTRMERWLAYFSNKLDAKEREELAMSETAIQNAMAAADIFMQNSEERLAYLNREMAILDYNSDKSAWTEEGRIEGRMEGERNIIHNMIRQGMDNEFIKSVTSWSIEDIQHERQNQMNP